MDNFKFEIATPFYPGWLIYLAAIVLVILLTTMTELIVFVNTKRFSMGRGRASMVGGLVLLFGVIVGAGLTSQIENNLKHDAVAAELRQHGLTHVDYSHLGGTLTASYSGQYINAVVLSEDNVHFAVFVK